MWWFLMPIQLCWNILNFTNILNMEYWYCYFTEKNDDHPGTRTSSSLTSVKHAPATASFNHETNIQRISVVSDSVGIPKNNNPFLNMYLNQNAPIPPLVLPQVDYSYSVQRQRNSSFYAPKNNPNEYTIGGVLSGREGIDHHFIQTLNVS